MMMMNELRASSLQGRQDPGLVRCWLSLPFWECRSYPAGTPVQPDPVPAGHAVCWAVSSRYTTSTLPCTVFGNKATVLFYFSLEVRGHFTSSEFFPHQVHFVQQGQWRPRFAPRTVSEALQEVQAGKTASPAHLSTGVKRVRVNNFVVIYVYKCMYLHSFKMLLVLFHSTRIGAVLTWTLYVFSMLVNNKH